jgi:hypothetical protein
MAFLSSLLDKLSGRRPDPTLNWPAGTTTTPQLNIAEKRVGELRFGDALDAAKQCGRPDRFSFLNPDYCELLYANAGFQIDFKEGKFCYVAYFIGPDGRHTPDHPELRFSRPRLLVDALHPIALSQQLEANAIERLLGEPKSRDTDAEETILFYNLAGLTLEFEFDGPTRRLKRFNAYLT